MALKEIPVEPTLPKQKFTINLDGVILLVRLKFNARMDRWMMDLLDTEGNVLVGGRPVFVNFDLFGRFVRDGLPPGRFVALDTSGQDTSPTEEELGAAVKLLYEEATSG